MILKTSFQAFLVFSFLVMGSFVYSQQTAMSAGIYRVDAEKNPTSFDVEIQRLLPAFVYKHVDGDTIKVRIENPPPGIKFEETIRLIGVDTPETVHPSKPVQEFGKEASDFTKYVLLNKKVYLAFDWDLRDRYGRLLAYVYRGPEQCFNAELIYNGYAHAYTTFPFCFANEFSRYQRLAKERKVGLWAK